MRKKIAVTLITLPILAVLVYQLPPVKSRLEWRIAGWTARIQRAINPPEEVVFVPSAGEHAQGTEIAGLVEATLDAILQTATGDLSLGPAGTSTPPGITGARDPAQSTQQAPGPSATAGVPPTPTIPPTAIPESITLTGIRHEYEQWNNCGPVTIGMQLSFWGWQGNQSVTAPVLKPNPRDKNVGPAELVAYVDGQTEFSALYRVGGTQEMLKALVAAGFPVIVEKTLDLAGVDGWIGHYSLISAYDDALGRYLAQDSYVQADLPEPYGKLEDAWRSFNYTFVVTYPEEREEELLAILGPWADPQEANRIALARAEAEIESQTGLAQFFAWFNRGSSLVGLGDFSGAAAAYDTAFNVYAQLDPAERPWRMLWYQFGPYIAYMETGRYQDVVDLADTTLSTMGEQTVEETFFYRGLAFEQLGDRDAALADLRQAVELNANYDEAAAELARLEG